LTEHGFYDATIDPAQIEAWWRRWPEALIGVPTGKLSRLVILDVDVKDPRKNGFDSLADLGRSILPDTPMAHSGSGGLHIYFACIDQEIRNSESELGPGLDVRGEGGYIIVPAPGSGYTWDPHCNFNTVALLPAPAWLGHRRRRERPRKSGYSHLDPQALLAISCRLIRAAGNGERHKVLNREGFIVGTLVGAHALNQNEAYHQLEAAAAVMVSRTGGDFDKAERDLAGAFVDGLGQPRRVRR
jgi:putative DNA primase/helicase